MIVCHFIYGWGILAVGGYFNGFREGVSLKIKVNFRLKLKRLWSQKEKNISLKRRLVGIVL